ncbi:prolyl oligopeptidase family serine peptidase [Actinoplanes sp. RD1]|uniref:prolyl oligopeptidase family serine peptidase n=1 Tax=Actinoplanes sp. RD1 TaxID=3064538 RepID=UPI0027407495|nr:prolyl oligopeptidase family serine peptidase [Actinoplanes sp. RD1]
MTGYPPAPRTGPVEVHFGHQVPDPYRWLEDGASAATTSWSARQDELFAAYRAAAPATAGVQDRLRQLAGHDFVSAPAWRGNRHFLVRRPAGQEHGSLWVAEPDGTQRVLVDPAVLDPSGRTTLDIWQASPEGDLVAYQLSAGGTEESQLRVLAVDTGRVVDGPIDRTRYSMLAWLPDGTAFYYVRKVPPECVPDGEAAFHRRVFLHRIGRPAAEDVEIFPGARGPELPAGTGYALDLSRDGRWLVISASAGPAPVNRVWLADLTASHPGAPEFAEVELGGAGVAQLSVGRDGRGYAFTTVGAPRGRLCVFDPLSPGPASWQELIAERPDAVLRTWSVLDGPELGDPLLVAGWVRHTVSEVTVHDLRTGKALGELALPGSGAVGGLSVRPTGGHEAWFTYTDHVTPPVVHHWDARTDELRVWAAPGGVARPAATAGRETCRSADGTEVGLLVVAPPDCSGPRPVLLRGYGGFGVTIGPHYSPEALAWVRAGGIYVHAQVRGGGEEGESWHRDGMGTRKQHSFDDFHAVAEHLIRTGRTTPGQLAVAGSSNGGLLVGAALTQRPELYAAVVCSAPLLDMVRYEHGGLGRLWTAEYGSAADPGPFEHLLSYSPYHHVRDGVRYPAVLFTVSDNDTRVEPWHARKMCAALQHAGAGDGPILLRRDPLGHGARSLSSAIALLADALVFAARHTGMDVAALC